MEDAFYAQLLGMGFDSASIEDYCLAMAGSGTPLNLQAATEWLLERTRGPSGLTTPSLPADTNKPMSSTKDFTSSAAEGPLHSRYAMSVKQARDKDRYQSKEREEVVRKAREMKAAELRAKQLIKMQIADDRKARSLRMDQGLPANEVATVTSVVAASGSAVAGNAAADTCRVQIRLPGGRSVRYTFQSSITLNDVASAVMADTPGLTAVQFVQPFPPHEYTQDECVRTLQALGLCPSVSLVVQLPKHTPQKGEEGSRPMTRPNTSVLPEAPPMDTSHDQVSEAARSSVDIPGDGEGESLDRPYSPERSPDRDEDMEADDQGALFQPPAVAAGRHVQFNMGPQVPTYGGHRLGGTSQPSLGGVDRLYEATAAREATLRRMQDTPPQSSGSVQRLHPTVPSLESICIKQLLGMNASRGLPQACGSLPPRLVHTIIDRLVEAKQLHGRTLLAFHKCPLESISFDSYAYATNDLIGGLKYFPSLTSLSLAFCPLITDKAVLTLLPYLPSLAYINLNGCRQLNEVICRTIRGCKYLKVLKLSQVKVSDEGVRLLLQQPLDHLEELDLSHTLITSWSLQLLPEGTPNLQTLSIEATKADNFMFLCQLSRLHTLSVAQCPPSSAVGSLAGCRQLQSLNLSDVTVQHWALQQLSRLNLTAFKLPSRNTFTDGDMVIISGFPLISLDLSDYCLITDVGIASIAPMHSLTDLSLCRTKITDEGLAVVKGLTSLLHLRLDNTVVTDIGMKYIAGLASLDQLSLSDTRVTSQFIMDGCLDQLHSLTKLNLSRTAVCDRGIARLSLPSLSMLNVDWTCVSDAISVQGLKTTGCPVLDTLRASNIGQPKPSWAHREGVEPQL